MPDLMGISPNSNDALLLRAYPYFLVGIGIVARVEAALALLESNRIKTVDLLQGEQPSWDSNLVIRHML